MMLSAFDKNIIDKILPLHCEGYLEGHGWKEIGKVDVRASIWSTPDEKRVLLPLDTELADYASRIVSFLETLKKIESRPLESIIADLLQASSDTFRITAYKGSSEVNLPLVDASTLIKRSLDIISSVAQSLIKPAPYFCSRHPKEVDDFVSKLKMGHTERGSFVVAIHAPVSPRLKSLFDSQSSPELFSEQNEPFERRVMMRLSRLIPLAVEAANKRDEKMFVDSIDKGISANFCEAVSDVAEICGNQGAHLNISWALTRPPMAKWGLKNQFLVRPDTAAALKEAGELLKKDIPEKDVSIEGYVVRLAKGPEAKEGEVLLLDTLSDRPRHIFVPLNQDLYGRALEAHKQGIKIRMSGDLARDGKRYKFTNNKEIIFLKEEDVD